MSVGATACAAPQVKRRAEGRLASLVDPAIAELGRLLRSKSPSVVLGAVKDILDRNGFKPKDVVVVERDIRRCAQSRARTRRQTADRV
jgi:hypothetical protein